jgi:hypothetical protein
MIILLLYKIEVKYFCEFITDKKVLKLMIKDRFYDSKEISNPII